jgi:MFS family permease
LDGLQFTLVRERTLLWLIATAGVHTFGTSAFSTLFPVIGRALLHLGPVEVGSLWSAFGVGLFAISLGLSRMTGWSLTQRASGIAVASMMTGAAVLGLLWVTNRGAAAVLMGVIGSGVGVFTPIAWGMLQELSPDDLVGRVVTLYGTSAMVAAMVGVSMFGWLTQAYGERMSVMGIAVVMLMTAVAAMAFSRWLRAREPQA